MRDEQEQRERMTAAAAGMTPEEYRAEVARRHAVFAECAEQMRKALQDVADAFTAAAEALEGLDLHTPEEN